MNISPPTRTALILGICTAAVAGLLCYEHYQLSKLTTRLNATANKDSLESLLIRLEKVDERLNDTDSKHLVTNVDFRAAQQGMSNRLDTAQALTEETARSLAGLSQTFASSAELLQLKASVESIHSRVAEIGKSQIAAAVKKTVPSKPAARLKPSANKKPTPPLSPPFNVIGIEHRGGEQFLSVAPTGSTQLDQIDLIRPGEAVAGTTWKLSTIGANAASFDVAGAVQTITVVP